MSMLLQARLQAWLQSRCRRLVLPLGCLAALIALGFGIAHAASLQVRESSPAANATITGRHAEFLVRFDRPVDHRASRMELVQSGQVIRTLTPLDDSAPEVLYASGEMPPPGRYVLRWQVRSPDGKSIDQGDIPFAVRN